MIRRIRRRAYRQAKALLQAVGLARVDRRRALLVVGCQRSGTTMLMDAFDRDWRTKVFYEWNATLFTPSLRLRAPAEVRLALDTHAAQIVVAKPLLDSQHTAELLAQHPDAFAIWIYRHYAAVARSNLRRFGAQNGRSDIKPILSSDTTDWKAENVSSQVGECIRALFTPDSTDHDAAALFWYARNHLYFDQKLHQHPRVILCSYEEIAANPEVALQRVYDAADIRFPGTHVTRDIREGPVKPPKASNLSPAIEAACSELWQRLEQTRTARVITRQ